MLWVSIGTAGRRVIEAPMMPPPAIPIRRRWCRADWDWPMLTKSVRPALDRSYGRLCHGTDESMWFDQTHAITPLSTPALAGMPDNCPCGV